MSVTINVNIHFIPESLLVAEERIAFTRCLSIFSDLHHDSGHQVQTESLVGKQPGRPCRAPEGHTVVFNTLGVGAR